MLKQLPCTAYTERSRKKWHVLLYMYIFNHQHISFIYHVWGDSSLAAVQKHPEENEQIQNHWLQSFHKAFGWPKATKQLLKNEVQILIIIIFISLAKALTWYRSHVCLYPKIIRDTYMTRALAAITSKTIADLQ